MDSIAILSNKLLLKNSDINYKIMPFLMTFFSCRIYSLDSFFSHSSSKDLVSFLITLDHGSAQPLHPQQCEGWRLCCPKGRAEASGAKTLVEMRISNTGTSQLLLVSRVPLCHLKCLYIPQKPNFLVEGCLYLCVWGRRFIAVIEFIWQKLLHLAELQCQESWSWFLTRMCCLWRSRARGTPQDQKTMVL